MVAEIWATLLIAAGTYRVTRLLTVDEFPPLVKLRLIVAGRWGDDSWQSYLSECAWCASVWVGGLLTLAVALTVGVALPLLVWPTASAITGQLVAREPG